MSLKASYQDRLKLEVVAMATQHKQVVLQSYTFKEHKQN